MNNVQKINLSDLKGKYKSGLLIPEIQRDYVMGAGGKLEDGTDKLDNLLDAMLNAYKEKRNFDFSCIITYYDPEHERLEIYDGQQRLTTLILLYLFCLQREKNEEYKKYKNWYQFCERPIANDIISKLTDDYFDFEKLKITDFSSFSMKNLLERFGTKKYNEIPSCFFLENVVFDQVSIGNQSEIEQFFMDLNAGVKLKPYELYKAKLVHYINCIADRDDIPNDAKNRLKAWVYKLDNEWLDAFLPFDEFSHPSEEYEIVFLRYCFRMLGEGNDTFEKLNIDKLNTDMRNKNILDTLNKCYDIMNSFSELHFNDNDISSKIPQIVEFSWGTEGECSETTKEYYVYDDNMNNVEQRCYNEDKRCAYWNLKYKDNLRHLLYIIKNVLLESGSASDLDDDILVWAYITSLDWKDAYQNEYIRILKIIMNHNVGTNLQAWYECQKKGQFLYYARYGVRHIPDYYGKHIKDKNLNSNEISDEDFFKSVRDVIKSFFEERDAWKQNMTDMTDKEISQCIMERIKELSGNKRIQEILENRERCVKSLPTDSGYEDFCCKIEDPINGVMENLMNDGGIAHLEKDYLEKDYYYLGDGVTFSWPTQGKHSSYGGKNEPCFVLLKCYMDKCYSKFNEEYHQWVQKYETQYKDYPIFEKEKCFWGFEKSASEILAYRIMDRAYDTAVTYARRGGTDNYDWAYKFDGQNPPCCI